MPVTDNLESHSALNNEDSQSFDSETTSELGIQESGNHIGQQWDAIERTLYQEDGEHVMDSELLKECKLWRESFPHFRIKGTKIENETSHPVKGSVEIHKSIQTTQNHISLCKLEQKRDLIKNKVVGELVERLVAKFNGQARTLKKLPNYKDHKEGLTIVEINEKPVSDAPSKSSEKIQNGYSKGMEPVAKDIANAFSMNSLTEREKFPKNIFSKASEIEMSGSEMEERLYKIIDALEEESKEGTRLVKSEREKTQENRTLEDINFDFTKMNGKKIGLNSPSKSARVRKSRRSHELLSDQFKAVEITTTIDRKYERLLNKIMERTCQGLNSTNSGQSLRKFSEINEEVPKLYKDTLEKRRDLSGLYEANRRTNLPRINNSRNFWFKDNASHGQYAENRECASRKNWKTQTNKIPCPRNVNDFQTRLVEPKLLSQLDEEFLLDLEREVAINCKVSPAKNGILKEITANRQKPFTFPSDECKRRYKSSSCGDLPSRNKKNLQGRQLKMGSEAGNRELSTKRRSKFSNEIINKHNRNNQRTSNTLPPIESGIVCIELTGHPKIGNKNLPKRRF